MPVIRFFEEDVNYNLKNKLALKRWITSTIVAEGFKLKELSYILCSDGYLLRINQEYLNHDTYTDIITFDNTENKGGIRGDIFISIDRVRENAKLLHTADTDELHRVMVHGALHLLGYKDKSKADKAKMTIKEDFYLAERRFNK